MPPVIKPIVDVELLLVNYLQAQLGDNVFDSGEIRIATRLPEDLPPKAVRVNRVSGAARNRFVDRPIVDIDVFCTDEGTSVTLGDQIHDLMQAVRNLVTDEGVVSMVDVIIGPRWLPDINQEIFRRSASYELHTHGA
jgi:hypothetical protein